jgi:hypothetical protein
MGDMQQQPPDKSVSPLFEPAGTKSPFQKPQIPVAVMVAPVSASATPPPKEESEEQSVMPFIQQLRYIEVDAKAQMETWDVRYLGQMTEATVATSATGTKRKGMSLHSCCNNSELTICLASEMDSDSVDDNDDENDDSDSDTEGDRVAPHDPDAQDRPKLPIYHPGFKLTEEIAQKILTTFYTYITETVNNGYKDEEANHLREQIVTGKKIKYQEAVKLAVAGDTGAGKSALLNAILGIINLNIEVCYVPQPLIWDSS